MDALMVQGTFDVPAAKALESAMTPLSTEDAARIDFSRVREFHTFALASFAEWLVRSGRRVVAQGLRDHELRVLRYLGIGASVLGVSVTPRATSVAEAA